MQFFDLLCDLRLFFSLPHIQKGFKRVKILSHNSHILNTFKSVFEKRTSLQQGCIEVIPKTVSILNPPTIAVDASDSQLHQDYIIDSEKV
jgi:hypothetical protein